MSVFKHVSVITVQKYLTDVNLVVVKEFLHLMNREHSYPVKEGRTIGTVIQLQILIFKPKIMKLSTKREFSGEKNSAKSINIDLNRVRYSY